MTGNKATQRGITFPSIVKSWDQIFAIKINQFLTKEVFDFTDLPTIRGWVMYAMPNLSTRLKVNPVSISPVAFKVESIVRCDELGNSTVCTSDLNLALYNITFRLDNTTLPSSSTFWVVWWAPCVTFLLSFLSLLFPLFLHTLTYIHVEMRSLPS